MALPTLPRRSVRRPAALAHIIHQDDWRDRARAALLGLSYTSTALSLVFFDELYILDLKRLLWGALGGRLHSLDEEDQGKKYVYTRLVAPVLRYARDRMAAGDAVDGFDPRQASHEDLLSSAISIWVQTARPTFGKSYESSVLALEPADFEPFSEQTLRVYQTASLYVLALIECLGRRPTSPPDFWGTTANLGNVLLFTYKASAASCSIPAQIALDLDHSLTLHLGSPRKLMCINREGNWATLSQVLKQLGLGEKELECARRESKSPLEGHLEDVESIGPLLDSIKQAATLPAASIDYISINIRFNCLLVFMFGFTPRAALNADWIFRNGAVHLCQIFTQTGVSKMPFYNATLLEALMEHEETEGLAPHKMRSSLFARLGVLDAIVEACVSIDPTEDEMAETQFVSSIMALTQFLRSPIARQRLDLPALMLHLWERHLPSAGQPFDEPLRPTAFDELVFARAPLQPGGRAVLRLLAEMAPHLFACQPEDSSRIVLKVEMQHFASLLRITEHYKKAGGPAIYATKLLHQLLDPPPDAAADVVFERLAFTYSLWLLWGIPGKDGFWARVDKITAHMLELLKADSPNPVHLAMHLSQRGLQCWRLWAMVGGEDATLATRWRALELVADIAGEAFGTEDAFLLGVKGLTRQEFVTRSRSLLVDFVDRFIFEFIAGREIEAWSEQPGLLTPLTQIFRLISILYDEKLPIPSAEDAEKDHLLGFCSVWLDAGLQPELRRDCTLETLACLVELSNAVLPLIYKAGSDAGQKVGAARSGGVTAEAGNLCARLYEQMIEYAGARKMLRSGSSFDCGTTMLIFRDRGPESAVGLVLNRLARGAAIVLKKGGFNAFEQSSLDWPSVWHRALAISAICLRSDSVEGKRMCQARLDAANLTDIFTRVLVSCKKTHLPEFQRILCCIRVSIMENDVKNRPPASLLRLIKSMLEAHLVLVKLVPDPQQWASRCRATWNFVLGWEVKLPAATMAKLDTFKRQLAALVHKGAAMHEEAALSLLEEEEAEARKQAKKAKKKSKQQARKQKAQAAKISDPSEAPSTSTERQLNHADKNSRTSGFPEPANVPKQESAGGLPKAASADLPEAACSSDQLDTRVTSSADLDRDARLASSDIQCTMEVPQYFSTKGAQEDGTEPRFPSTRRTESSSKPQGTTAAKDRNRGHAESAAPPPGLAASKPSSANVSGLGSTGEGSTTVLHRPRPKCSSGKQPVCLPDARGLAENHAGPLAGPKSQQASERKLELPAAEIPSSSPGHRGEAVATECGGMDLIDQFEDLCTCPITHEYFLDPVTAADGFTYERSKIEEWLRKSATSPTTGAPLPSLQLRPNLSVRQMLGTVRRQREWQDPRQ